MLFMADLLDKDSNDFSDDCSDFLITCVVCKQPFQYSKYAHYSDDLNTECVISELE